MKTEIKPNIIVLAIIGGLLAWTTGSEALSTVLITGIVTTMFLLGGPKPNPKISKEIVMALISGASGNDYRPSPLIEGREKLVLFIVVIGASVTVVLAIFGHLTGTGLEMAVGGLIGMIGTLSGKMVDPGDDDTGTQEVALRLIDIMNANGSKKA